MILECGAPISTCVNQWVSQKLQIIVLSKPEELYLQLWIINDRDCGKMACSVRWQWKH